MGKIGDLWVKLGLKNDEFKKGMNEAKTETEGFGAKMNAVAGKAKMLWFAVGAAAAKMALDFVQSTQKMGDAWDGAMAKCKAGWNQFINSLMQWNWEGFGQRMRNAMNAAADVVASQDMTFEVQNSINIRKAAMREELAELQIQAKKVGASYEERAAAAQSYLDKVEGLYADEQALRNQQAHDIKNQFLSDAGIAQNATNRAALERFLVDAAPNGKLLAALEKEAKHAQGKRHGTLTADERKMVDKFLEGTTAAEAGALMEMANYYQNGINGKKRDEKIQKVVDAIANAYAANGAFKDENRRMFAMLDQEEGAALTGGNPASALITDPAESAYQDATAILARVERVAATIDKIWSDELAAYLKDVEGLGDDLQPVLDDIQDSIISALVPEEIEGFDLGEGLGNFLDSAIDGLVDATQELADALANVGDLDGGELFKALLDPMLDTAKQMGALMIKMAAGMIAVEKSIKNPYALLAAGAALVAIAAAGKAALAGVVSGGTATTSTSTTAGDYGQRVQTAELVVHVKGTIKGSDIVLSGQNTLNEWSK